MGSFYNYWYCNYLNEEEYDKVLFNFISEKSIGLDISDFDIYYNTSKHSKISRSERVKMFKYESTVTS